MRARTSFAKSVQTSLNHEGSQIGMMDPTISLASDDEPW